MSALIAIALLATTEPRVAFRAKLDQVRVGMSKAQVIKILGKPDDIWTSADRFINGDESLRLCYGSNRHLGLPTLGSITFDQRGRAHEIYGTKGKQYLPEPELAELLRYCSRPPNEVGNDPIFF